MFGSHVLNRFWGGKASTDRGIARYLIGRGNAARDARDWVRAAQWYEEALKLTPDRADIHVQHGHMLKEAGAFDAAEQAYLQAAARMPHDADLALQMGHLYKLSGDLERARGCYEQALTLKPRWSLAERELNARLAPDHRSAIARAEPPIQHPAIRAPSDLAQLGRSLQQPQAELVVESLEPRPEHALLRAHDERIDVQSFGRHEPGTWGSLRTVCGVEALRGFCLSRVPIVEAQILLNGNLVCRSTVSGGFPVAFEALDDGPRKYVFNIWHDFARFPYGRHAFELRLIDSEGEARSFHDMIAIAPPLSEADFPDSDALVEVREVDPAHLERSIRARPSMVRPARRTLFKQEPRSILVMRTDQLGDMVASIPAMQRLREIFPDARFVGLLTAANADLARSLKLFDEILIAEFPDDRRERRRLMTMDAQLALRDRLAEYQFDLAIDLAQASVSRDLLRLSGAAFRYGVDGAGFEWLDAAFALNTRDPVNRLDRIPHSRKILALIETLGALHRDSFQVIRRTDLDRGRLADFGIAEADRYAVLHMGARVEFSRWPGFPQLASMLLNRTDLKVVMMTEDPAVRPMLPPELLQNPGFQLLDRRLSFDDFDTFVSFAAVLVGNDSGPKHLAALRGTEVVTLHTARINWTEWGQEDVGTVISRRVPCAGCAIFHDAEECGKDFACIRDIRPEEVFAAVSAYV